MLNKSEVISVPADLLHQVLLQVFLLLPLVFFASASGPFVKIRTAVLKDFYALLRLDCLLLVRCQALSLSTQKEAASAPPSVEGHVILDLLFLFGKRALLPPGVFLPLQSHSPFS